MSGERVYPNNFITFGGQKVYDPTYAKLAVAAHHLPTLDLFWGKANSYMTTSGGQPGRGWLLMTRAKLNALGAGYHNLVPEGLYDLVLNDVFGDTVTVKNLMVLRAQAVTPGTANDPNTLYVVEITDKRHYAGRPMVKDYNVRAPDGGANTFYASSAFNMAGDAWTYQQQLDDLWTAINLTGTSPVLPYSPHGAPEDWRFHGIYTWDAYSAVLARLDCAFVYDLADLAHKLVRFGDSDSNFNDAMTAYANQTRLLYDAQFIEPNRAKVPKDVHVLVHRYEKHYGSELTTIADTTQWASQPCYDTVVTDPQANPNTVTNNSVILWDDIQAIINIDGTKSNSTAVANRATERAANYYQMLTIGGARLHRIFKGWIAHAGVRPGSLVSGTAWYDYGWGACTEIRRVPGLLKIDAAGKFQETDSQEAARAFIRPPDLGRASFPLYPHLLQVVRVTSSTPNGDGFYDGYVERYNPDTKTWSDKEIVYVANINA